MKNRVKEYAENKKINLEILAKQTNLSRTTIYSIARGSSMPSIEKAYRISKALNVPVQELFIDD